MAKNLFEETLRACRALNEEEFNLTQGDEIKLEPEAQEGEVIEPVIDPEYEEGQDGKSYLGKNVIFCNICLKPFFSDSEIDETTTCPTCGSDSTELELVGKVCSSETGEEPVDPVPGDGVEELDIQEEPVDGDLPVEEEDEEDEEEIGESLKTVKECDSANRKRVQPKKEEVVEEGVNIQVNTDDNASVTVTSDDANVNVSAETTNPVDATLPADVVPEVESDAEITLPVADEEEEEPEFEYEEESFNQLFTKFLTDNYKNVKSFSLVEAKLKNKNLVFEGVITFDNGNARTITVKTDEFRLTEGVTKVKAACPLFGKSKAFVLEHVMKENKLSATKMNYRYRTRVNNESYDVVGRVAL